MANNENPNGSSEKDKASNDKKQDDGTQARIPKNLESSDVAITEEKKTSEQDEKFKVTYISSDDIESSSLWRISDNSLPRRSWEGVDYIDFDDLLPMIGEFGVFQVVLFLFMIPFCFITAFVYLGQIFMTLPPPKFYCFEPQLSMTEGEELRKQLSIPREADGSYSRCRMYSRNYTIIHFAANKSQYINTSLPTIPCRHGYVFDEKEMPFRSATMEFGWLCEDDRFATYAQIIFFAGSIVGSLAYGYFADNCGRLAALVSSCFLAILGSLATALAQNFLSFAVSRFLVGASYDTCFTMVYILVLEYVGPRYRTLVANLALALFYSPSTMLMPWIALATGNWRMFSGLACIPIAMAMFSYCVLPESARWLVSVGEIDKAVLILKRMARLNRKLVPTDVFDLFKKSCREFYKEELLGRSFTVISIFRRRRMCRYLIVMILIWMAMSLVYDGHVRAASVLDSSNIFLFFTIACATELPGNILVILTLDRCGRRWCSFAFTSLSGICSLMGAGVKDLLAMRISALCGRFFANMCYNIGLQWAAEILPTVVRAQGVSFIHTMGFVAMLMSPPVVYLSRLSFALMLVVLGVLGIFGGFMSLFLPETLNHELPETLSEGDIFGRNQKCWHMPCCGPGKRVSHPKRYWHKGSSLRTLSRDEYRSTKMFRQMNTSHSQKSIISDTSSRERISGEREIRTIKFNDGND